MLVRALFCFAAFLLTVTAVLRKKGAHLFSGSPSIQA